MQPKRIRMFLRCILLFIVFATAFSLSGKYFWDNPEPAPVMHSFLLPVNKSAEEFAVLRSKVSPVKEFILRNNYESRICFLVNMKLASGRKRFFVYDLEKDSILSSGLVAHGSCDNGFQDDAIFSNKINSGCSSFGKFKVGKSYYGRFGLAYKLYGLDSSNDNAFDRTIVLHSYKCVPEQETYPLPICNSRGCPMVSPEFLEKLKTYVDNSEKPDLLNIFY